MGLAELAKVAGVTQGAVYIHFASKDVLVLATVAANKVSNTCLPIIGATLILAARVEPAPGDVMRLGAATTEPYADRIEPDIVCCLIWPTIEGE